MRERLGAEGMRHSLGVADTAARLAETYGVDVEPARLAGLLHDWAKDATASELLSAADDHGIPVTDVDRAVPYLLHAPVAAAELKAAMPDLDDQVLAAVAAHTYGAESMSPIDLIVYVADTIEPGRVHAGVETLRDAVGVVSLQELFMLAYASSLRHLVDSRRRIHPATVALWNRLVSEDPR
ncbi:MAG: HD domain-containing protein [Actinobacteria bacterium]|nr:MAG: HD domain-containing protein [Actinomycetota bacterium]